MTENTEINTMSEIQSFFKDSSVFVTGATGFLGHVLLAKLLKTCPDVKKIYILLRTKKGKNVSERFQEMMEDVVFETIKSECPGSLMKIHPIAGDCLLPNLGINVSDADLLKQEVDIVFHVAATVKFDAPLKYAVQMNVRATSDLLDLAREMKNLKSFVHVSTAFSNCVDREEIDEKLYKPPISSEQLLTLVENLDEKHVDTITPSLLGNYPNTYIYTKAVAEDLCRTKGAGLPLAIFRPAIVISTATEPIPGWINNVYGPTGVVAAAAVGLLHVLQVDRNSKANVVPCDYVVNATIASAWSVGTNTRSIGTELVNQTLDDEISLSKTKTNGKIITDINSNEVVSKEKMNKTNASDVMSDQFHSADFIVSQPIPVFNYSCDLLKKPITWKEFMDKNSVHEKSFPSAVSVWAYSFTIIKNQYLYKLLCMMLHIFPAFIFDTCAKILGKEPRLMDAYQKVHKLSDVLSYFSTREWKISNKNVTGLWDNLSQQDKTLFNFDMNVIDWDKYYYQHCEGIHYFIMKEKPENKAYSQRRRMMFKILHYILISTLSFTSFFAILKLGLYLLR